MAYSEVGICNLALGHVRAASIASLTEQSNEAIACNRYYALSRDRVLRDFPWNFARARSSLALLAQNPETGWRYKYAYPSECLFAREIEGSPEQEKIPFELAHDGTSNARAVLTDQAEAVLIYTGRIKDPTQFDPLFVSALSYHLASSIAELITGDERLRAATAQAYEAEILTASRANHAERQTLPPLDPDWIRGR